jgi:hypothetical protein
MASFLAGLSSSGTSSLPMSVSRCSRSRLQQVEIAPDPNYDPSLVQSTSLRIIKYTPRLWELKTGESVSFRSNLPEHWERQLRPGETYELLWLGGMITLCDWETTKECLGKELRLCSETGRDPLVLPGGAHTLLSVGSVRSPPVPRVSPGPVQDENRVYVFYLPMFLFSCYQI